MKTIPVHVTSASTAAQGIRLLKLAALDGSPLPRYEPGSHIDLHLAPGVIRQYSLCGPHGDTSSYAVAVKLEPESRGGSRLVHDMLDVGSQLQISAPRNNFPMASDARHSVLVAGGIGITPLISMARALQAEGHSFELLYFCRNSAHAAFRDELESEPFAASSHFFFGLDRDTVGHTLNRVLAARPNGAHLYLCGPRPFMDSVQEIARQTGWPEEAVHLEYFAAGERAADASANARFRVKLARSGVTIDVPADKTIVDSLREQGIEIETSCEQGVCGTCLAVVLEGTPEHHDSFLSATEKDRGDCMAVCISRSQSPLLVLDL
jgi:vanillate monooxygenase ferredoxin subunit